MIETKPWAKAQTVTLWQKLNVLWWFGNVEGIDQGYEPSWPQWKRAVFWFFRNFMFNFFRFVVGVEDRDLLVMGLAPVFVSTWHEMAPPQRGFKWAIIKTGWLRLPFVSYSGAHLLWYLGWLPSGGRLGFKFNLV